MESVPNHWNLGNGIRYGKGRNIAQAGRSGITGNLKLKGFVFDVWGNASAVVVLFKIKVEQCSEYTGSKFKDNPTGAVAAI